MASVVLSWQLLQGQDYYRHGGGLITSAFLMKQMEEIVQQVNEGDGE
jgi:hypothetical protein